MMTDTEIIDGILRREAGYADRRADRGGPTNMGITLDTLSAVRGYRVTKRELLEMPESEARAIYRDRYLQPWAWVPDDKLRVFLVDWAVTSWHDDPTRALQRAVGAAVDGVLGPETKGKTLDALAVGKGPDIFRAVLIARAEFYMHLALDEPQFTVLLRSGPPLQVANLRGWLRERVLAFV